MKHPSPCIRTERLVFHVPIDFPAILIWYKDGASYRLKSTPRGIWRDTDIDIFVIEQLRGSETLSFAYSTEFGVLAIHAGEAGREYTLIGACGFAAMPSSRHCRRLRPD